jgi:hypothetical protein
MMKFCNACKESITIKPLPYVVLLLIMTLLAGCAELGVYTLCSYEDNWKGNVCVENVYDPYYDFWKVMTAGGYAPYASPLRSHRLRNSKVHIQTIIPISGDSHKSWDEYDMVFFYGHHNTIVPPHPHSMFRYSNYINGTWVQDTGYLDTIGWGHTTSYDYWAIRPVNNAHIYPASVTYLYNKYTSSLIGQVYDYSGGNVPWRKHWYDGINHENYGKLGDKDLEWLILHGCQAVITANEDGSYNPLALNVFAPAHGRWHIVLGHYVSYHTYELQPLDSFAYDLLANVPIQTAYFDTDPSLNTSAIAAETTPFSWSNSTIVNDRWDDPMVDYPGTDIFSQRWIVPLGNVASHW